MLTPKGEALAFRIWQYAEPLGWECTTTEVADAIRSTPTAVSNIARAKGWNTKLRKSGYDSFGCYVDEPIREITARYARLAEELPE